MLKFTKDDQGNFLIIETTCSAFQTKVMTVRYTPDLSQKQVNSDPWRDCRQVDIEWFEKYYRKHYK